MNQHGMLAVLGRELNRAVVGDTVKAGIEIWTPLGQRRFEGGLLARLDDEPVEAEAPELFTPDALALITEAARRCGWSVDYIELRRFVEWCYEQVGQPAPGDLEPYPRKDDGSEE